MQIEEYVPPELEDDQLSEVPDMYDGMNASISDDTLNTHSQNSISKKEEFNSLRGFYKVYHMVNKKPVRIEFYETSYCPGSFIRNAVTGYVYKGLRVGKSDEDLLFKVNNATGETGKGPHFLYYDNPEQWERHFHCVCPVETKQFWLEKYMNEKKKRNM